MAEDKYYDELVEVKMPRKYAIKLKAILSRNPDADVVEVKQGYWKDRFGNKYDNHLYECSVCGKKALYEVYLDELQQTKIRQVLSNACPHCLAKMNVERKNENE